MKYRVAKRLLESDHSRSRMADFFLSPIHHPDLVMSLLLEKQKRGDLSLAGVAADDNGPTRPSKKGLSSWIGNRTRRWSPRFRMASRVVFGLFIAMFLSCAVAPNHGIGGQIEQVSGFQEKASYYYQQRVEPYEGALYAGFLTGEAMLRGEALPDHLADSFIGRLLTGRFAGLALVDESGSAHALAGWNNQETMESWLARNEELERENNILRVANKALREATDSNKIYLEINLQENNLYVKMSHRTLYVFPVVTGKGYLPPGSGRHRRFETPRGIMKVIEKEVNPIWHPPAWHWTERGLEAPRYRPAIRGVLGKRRLLLPDGFGIHGTSSGRINQGYRSHGCIRMKREDIKIVFDLAEVGTEVFIY